MTDHFSTLASLESDAADLRQQLAAERLAHTQTLAELGLVKEALKASEAERSRLLASDSDLAELLASIDEQDRWGEMALDLLGVHGWQMYEWLIAAGPAEAVAIAGELETFLEMIGGDECDAGDGGDAGKWETN
jgi:hypothetical protein